MCDPLGLLREGGIVDDESIVVPADDHNCMGCHRVPVGQRRRPDQDNRRGSGGKRLS